MLGRWLQGTADTLLIEEPTRGIDIGAKVEIYRLLRDFVEQGGAVGVLVSSELIEVIGLSDHNLRRSRRTHRRRAHSASATEQSVLDQSLRSGSDDHRSRSASRPVIQMGGSGISRYTVSLPVLLFAALALTAPDFSMGRIFQTCQGKLPPCCSSHLASWRSAWSPASICPWGCVVSSRKLHRCHREPSGRDHRARPGTGLAVGLVNGCGIAVAGIHPLIMTSSSMTFLQGLALAGAADPGRRRLAVPPARGKDDYPGNACLVDLVCCGMALLGVLLYRTRLGLHIFAVGANRRECASEWRAQSPGHSHSLCAVQPARGHRRPLSERPRFLRRPDDGAAFALGFHHCRGFGRGRLTGGVGSILGVVTGSLTLGFVTNGINLLGISPFLRLVVTGTLLLVAICSQRRSTIGL